MYPLPDSPQSTSTYVKYETSRSATETTDPSEVADNPDGENKELKLKGVEWPGMGGFDAATPAQQRKRNQRKHVSVLEQMKLASKAVEQNEYIWDETMQEIQKTRNIYDSPSIDGSPVSRALYVMALFLTDLLIHAFCRHRRTTRRDLAESAAVVVLRLLRPARPTFVRQELPPELSRVQSVARLEPRGRP